MAGAAASAAALAVTLASCTVADAGAPARRFHGARGSPGCGKALNFSTGETTLQSGVFAGVERTWLLHVPASYNSHEPVPLIIALHGWQSDGPQLEGYVALSNVSEQKGFIVAYPNGMADNANWDESLYSWGSWNVAGTSLSLGPQGPTCTGDSYWTCYTSCPCNVTPMCSWTTCRNDVTPTGMGNDTAEGFLPGLYDRLADDLCIDLDRLYATGFSNGGMATYQLGVSLAHKLAAIVPFAGSFQLGFHQAPPVPVPLIDVHGFEDDTVPANFSLSSGGWYFTPTPEILAGWRTANGCKAGRGGVKLQHWPTSMDGLYELYCVSEGEACVSPVVRCGFRGGHSMFADGGLLAAELAWELLSQFRKEAPAAPELEPATSAAASPRGGAIFLAGGAAQQLGRTGLPLTAAQVSGSSARVAASLIIGLVSWAMCANA